MKRYKIVWTANALAALKDIYLYISYREKSKRPANIYITKLKSKINRLESFPKSNALEPNLQSDFQENRFIVDSSYKIIYRIENNTDFIKDIFHTSQNPDEIITRNAENLL